MDKLDVIFKNRKVIFPKLSEFGFKKSGTSYKYSKTLSGSGFEMNVTINKSGKVSAKVTDPDTGEYTLHLTDSAGSFVGEVRGEYEQTLTEIAESCFEPDVFKADQTKHLTVYVRERYGRELEFLWDKFEGAAVWRRGDTNKWFAAVLTISRRKLGLDSDEIVEIIDLRLPPEEMAALVDGKRYFGGWHMNKKHWYTIILDGSVSFEELCRRIEVSYSLAVK
ncbi:MAG: MmcQ/YjbR family DNA-binding protein [Oscillospiraceae bacterium]|nr:MmcQ/YjbR family DNA-binding protein [Oscillospiraceae bacterium]